MPVSMVQIECPCCGRSVEVILVGSAHAEDGVEPQWLERKPRRKRKSKTQEAFERGPGSTDGAGYAQEPKSGE
jgi:hypothetical protein